MGYFSNGTEGDMYEQEYCYQCIHDENCAVWEAHLIYNYDECNNEKSILHTLIPRKGAYNEKCNMFYPKLRLKIKDNLYKPRLDI